MECITVLCTATPAEAASPIAGSSAARLRRARCLFQCRHDSVQLLLGQIGAERQAEHRSRQLLADGKALFATDRSVRGLLMHRSRIVHGSGNSKTLHAALHTVAIVDQHRVLRPGTASVRAHGQRSGARAACPDLLPIAFTERLAARQFPREPLQLRE